MSASLQEDDSGDQRVAPAVEGAGQDDPAFPAKAEFKTTSSLLIKFLGPSRSACGRIGSR